MGGHKNLFLGHTGVVGDCDLLAGRCVSIFGVALTVGPCRAVSKKIFFFPRLQLSTSPKKKKKRSTLLSNLYRADITGARCVLAQATVGWCLFIIQSTKVFFFFIVFILLGDWTHYFM